MSLPIEAFFPDLADWGKLPEVVDPADYDGQPAISVSCTQLADAKEQKRLVRAWAEALPRMDTITEFHFYSRFPSELLEPLSQATGLKRLWIRWSGLKTLAPLANLTRLQTFQLGSAPSAHYPEAALAWPDIEYLALESIRAVYDLSWIPGLKKVRHLSLSGSMWTTQKLKSLAPLESMTNLEWLLLDNARVDDKDSLFALARMPNLKQLDTAYHWPTGALSHLARLRPDLWINDVRGENFSEPDFRATMAEWEKNPDSKEVIAIPREKIEKLLERYKD